ncbi:methyltransferase domain-containing protein [Candidatus Liberibacter sp.]|uniref:methyltransferase domain-containing protein n=1 Tax=Candidatus Liberibacter sp. TaxID=34022 RepID=UPI0015F5ABDA|nr:methyltransferase domain-containing protein [Candidatus Liberibacter sp.]MBA5723574.1 methyltransferase domain-containing protein [Candidatus Liberibacter sp.]
MKPLFDMQLINANRLRALRQNDSSADFLLEIVAKEIAFRLSMMKITFENALELHGGTGIVGHLCMETKKILHLTRSEISSKFSCQNSEVLVSPIEKIPSLSQPVDLVLSPLNLHVINDILGMLLQINHILKPGGLFLAAIPGIGTLSELRKALLKAETELTGGGSPRVIPFMDIKGTGDLVQKAGFTSSVIDQDNYTVHYKSMSHLMHDLRKMGMTNPLLHRSRKPPRKSLFTRAAKIYAEENSSTNGDIIASFSIIYITGWSPVLIK